MMIKKLLELLPPHESYRIFVEVFGGGASLLFAKRPSPVEVYNDINEGLFNLFSVLRDPEKFEEFKRLVELTPFSRKEYHHARETYNETKGDVERAVKWYIMARQSFGGHFGAGWGYTIDSSSRGMAAAVSGYLSAVEMLPQIHQRIMRVQVDCDTFERVIERYDTPDTLFYCDPPYVPDTRTQTKYPDEMTREDHERLVDILLSVEAKVMLSGYPNDIYKRLEDAGWRRVDYQTACFVAGVTRQSKRRGEGARSEQYPRTECVWMNYDKDIEAGQITLGL